MALFDNLEKRVLANGMEFIHLSRPNQVPFFHIQFNYGALHEAPEQRGLAHFVEHLVLERGPKHMSAETSQKLLDRIPAYNGATSKDTTTYHGEMLSEDLNPFTSWLTGALRNPSFTEPHLTQEQQVILQEIRDQQSNKGYHSNRAFWKELCGADTPWNIAVAGDTDVIRHAEPEDLHAFHEPGYVGKNAKAVLRTKPDRDLGEIIEQLETLPEGKDHTFQWPKHPCTKTQQARKCSLRNSGILWSQKRVAQN